MNYLFPFESVQKNSEVIIFGAGRVGKSYMQQIKKTTYCKLVAFIDRDSQIESIEDIRVIDPNEIGRVHFDYVVLANVSKTERTEMLCILEKKGIPRGKIVDIFHSIKEDLPIAEISGIEDNRVHIIIRMTSGLGDAVMNIPLIYRIKELYQSDVEIIGIGKYSEILKNFSMVDGIHMDSQLLRGDLFINTNGHLLCVEKWDSGKVQKITPILYDVCLLNMNLIKEQAAYNICVYSAYPLSRLFNKHRCEICDIYGVLGVNRKKGKLIVSDNNKVLSKYGLEKKYIVINRDIGRNASIEYTKLWDKEHYSKLIGLIKNEFPGLCVVLVGGQKITNDIENFDFDLRGKTTFDDISIILKNALLLISSEGGLVHLMHFLGGRSAVVFGPTDENYFGYEEDFKFVNRPCSIPCNYVCGDWVESCMIEQKSEYTRCINRVKAEDVFEEIRGYLHYRIEIV